MARVRGRSGGPSRQNQRDRLHHVVVGPAGVFALETKTWSDRITRDKAGHLLVNGRRPTKDPGAQTRRNAMAVSDRETICDALEEELPPEYRPRGRLVY